MLEQVREYIGRLNMVARGDHVIVSVSGGPDSTALLYLLHELSGDLGIRLHVFHMDHGLRGEASATDARYVEAQANRLGLPCTVVRLEPGSLKRQPGSLQANARAIRYREIAALAGRIGAQCVALGHNRDDQAETVLMRFLRAAGTRGLGGIPPLRVQGGLTYIRPLLAVPRSQIEAYCTTHELFPRVDGSNFTPTYLRNRLRLELLPLLAREYNPAIAANLAQTADIVRVEDQFLDALAAEVLAQCRVPAEGIALRGNVLSAVPLALARRVVRLAARAATRPDFELSLDAVTRVLAAAGEDQGSHRLDLPDGLQVVVEYGVCRFECAEPQEGLSGEWPLALSGETIIPELRLRVTAQGAGVPHGPMEAAFDLQRLPGPLSVRLRQPGDRLWPVGMEGSKKLQDLLVDAKVPRRLRDRIPLIVSGPEVVWVVGYRVDRRFLAGPATERVLYLNANWLSESPGKGLHQ